MRYHNVRFDGIYTDRKSLSINTKYDRLTGRSPREDACTTNYINIINTINKDSLSILDFGGGDGCHYFSIKDKINKTVDYNIVERPIYTNHSGITFFSNVSEVNKDIDLYYSNGTLFLTQESSCEDNIKNICNLHPEYIVLHRQICSEYTEYDDFYTYATSLNLYFNILSLNKIIELFSSAGYTLNDHKQLPEVKFYLSPFRAYRNITYNDFHFIKQ